MNYEYDNEDEDAFESDKFDECHECTNRFCELTCDDCGAGESFEPEDPENLQDLII